MSIEYVRSTYNVPAKIGGRVRMVIDGKPTEGTIVGANHNLQVRLDGDKGSGWYHPTWNVEYLDPPAEPSARVSTEDL